MTTVIVVNPKRIDVGRSSPEIALYAADNLSGFIAQITRDRARAFVAGLGAVETAHAIEHADMGSALISVGRHGVSTESGSDRVSLISKIRIANNVYPVATALGTDLITKLGTTPFDFHSANPQNML